MPWPKGKPRPDAFKRKADPVSESVETEEAVSAAEPVTVPEVDPPAPMGAEALGKLAEMALGNPAVAEAFRGAVDDLARQWASTQPQHTAEREALYYEARAINGLQEKLRRIAQHGATAAKKRLRVA